MESAPSTPTPQSYIGAARGWFWIIAIVALSYDAAGCARWRELSDLERHIPERKGMRSVAPILIFAGEVWWSFLALGRPPLTRLVFPSIR